jgi:hypothetical protein
LTSLLVIKEFILKFMTKLVQMCRLETKSRNFILCH